MWTKHIGFGYCLTRKKNEKKRAKLSCMKRRLVIRNYFKYICSIFSKVSFSHIDGIVNDELCSLIQRNTYVVGFYMKLTLLFLKSGGDSFLVLACGIRATWWGKLRSMLLFPYMLFWLIVFGLDGDETFISIWWHHFMFCSSFPDHFIYWVWWWWWWFCFRMQICGHIYI